MIPKRFAAFAFILASTLILSTSPAFPQTSLSVSGYGAFNGTTTGNGVQQSPANQAGGIVELRHVSNPIFGLEATYSFNRANETYNCTGIGCPVSPAQPVCANPPCGPASTSVSVPANAHEITADWIPSIHVANVRPFGVLGAGVLLNIPAGSPANTNTSTKAVYVYGAGLDWGLIPHIGLRLQYRGNLYQAPNLTKLYTSTGAFTHTAEPMIGIYFNL